jgi:hypothetical protein
MKDGAYKIVMIPSPDRRLDIPIRSSQSTGVTWVHQRESPLMIFQVERRLLHSRADALGNTAKDELNDELCRVLPDESWVLLSNGDLDSKQSLTTTDATMTIRP